MNEQLALAVKSAAPEVTSAEIETVCEFLRGKGWIKAAEIAELLKIDDRKLRAITEHSEGLILSGPGCPGYKLFDGRAEIGEADQAASRLESQARHMLNRAIAYRRRIHRYAR
jgi:hypothetical protein